MYLDQEVKDTLGTLFPYSDCDNSFDNLTKQIGNTIRTCTIEYTTFSLLHIIPCLTNPNMTLVQASHFVGESNDLTTSSCDASRPVNGYEMNDEIIISILKN